jgi:hypothetical protein
MGFKCSRLYLSLPHLYFKESQHTYFDIVYFPTTYDKNSVFGFFFTILTSIFHTRNMYDLHHTLSVMEYSDLDFYLFLPVSFILSYISMIAIFFFCYCSLSVSGWSPALCVSSGWGYRHEPQYPASPSFLKDSYLGGVFLIGSFSFHHFDYIMLLSPGLPCFC